MIENFEKIASLLSFNSDDEFYLIQIIKRKKDNPEMTKPQKMIDVYEIESLADLEKHKPYIIEKCNEKKARAYIHLNKRSHKKIALETLRELASRVADSNFNIGNVYHSTMGKYSSDKNKTWLIDLDDEQVNLKDEILKTIIDIRKKYHQIVDIWHAEIPTKNGIHLIVGPFNPNEFSKTFKDINLQKDAPTVLYIGDNNE